LVAGARGTGDNGGRRDTADEAATNEFQGGPEV
jgi:hypothetical protein